jgi:hypothetical protein
MMKKIEEQTKPSADENSVPQTPQPAQPFVTATSRNPKGQLETGEENKPVPEKGESKT